jgi:C1A family cysteine protease/PKD repeat protein
MKKIFIYLIILILTIPNISGQKNTSWIFSNPNYQEYLELKQAGLWNIPGQAEGPLGYSPAPFTMRHNPTPAILPGYKSSEETMPGSYDLRDSSFVTDPKNQGGGNAGGNCTMFATMGSLESRWLEMGLSSFDLSEQNLAACHEYEWIYGEGANEYICSAYLTRFSGPVHEVDDPYNTSVHPCLDLEPIALIPEARWLPGRDFQLLKETIYNYGAVWVSVHIDMSSFRDDDDTYYYSGQNIPNHAFLVVGWDDSKVTAAGTAGAWIVKNSWGTDWAENGFVYVSYSDTQFANEIAYFPTRWETDEVDSLYIYDRLGMDSLLWALGDNELWELAKFEAPTEQLLTRVGLTAFNPYQENDNSIFDIEIYDDFTDGVLSGLLASRENILTTQNGIYSFEIPATVSGDFYVKVRRQIDFEDGFLPIEAPDDGYADPLIEQDVNWISSDGVNWQSTNAGTIHFGTLFSTGFNLTIRAYTSFDTGPKSLFTANKTTSCVNSDVIFTFLENDAVTSYLWDFGMNASPATATGIGPHTITYSGEGTKSISLIIDGPNGKDTITRHDYVYVTDEINVFLPNDQVRMIPGDTIEITAYGADEYVWIPSGIDGNNTGQTVSYTTQIEEEIDLTIYGSQGGCNDQTTLKIISSIPPANDNICDAILITPIGPVGTFTNEKATVEPGEPSPDPIGCVTDSTWCANEPGAVNSIWFYFYGPSSGIATLSSEGSSNWDNQVAVYRADSCIDVDKESLVAANDDRTASIYPFQLQLDVTPDAKYFVQLDGSGNDQEGTCDLYFYDSPVGLDDKTILWDGLSVFPNPASDIFNIHLLGMQSGKLQIQVYNTNGQLIIDRSSSIKPEEFNTRIDLSAYSDGLYFLRLVDGSRVMHRKLLKK